MLNGTDLMRDIELEIDILEPEAGQGMDPRVTDLKLKYMMVLLLKDIRTQLFEISHYGIGTD